MAFVTKYLVHRAVWWDIAPAAGSGGQVQYRTPVEIACRWKDVSEEIVLREGTKVSCHSMVILDPAITPQEQGVLWRGTIATLVSAVDPFLNPKAYAIQKITDVSDIPGTDRVLRAFL